MGLYLAGSSSVRFTVGCTTWTCVQSCVACCGVARGNGIPDGDKVKIGAVGQGSVYSAQPPTFASSTPDATSAAFEYSLGVHTSSSELMARAYVSGTLQGTHILETCDHGRHGAVCTQPPPYAHRA
jgi:hypothetical protein